MVRDLTNAPAEVLYAKFSTMIGYSRYVEIIEKYPEWFPEEYNKHQKWKSIPQSVHDEHDKEYTDVMREIYKNEPKLDGGIFHHISNPDDYNVWRKFMDDRSKESERETARLYNKYYGKYMK